MLFTEKQLKSCMVIRDDGSEDVKDLCSCPQCDGEESKGADAAVDLQPGRHVKCKWRLAHWRFIKKRKLDAKQIAVEYKKITCGTPRQRHVLATMHVLSAARVKCGKLPAKIINISQSIDRCSTSKDRVPVLTPQGKFFLMKQRRTLAAEEMLMLMNFPLDDIDLGGNSSTEVASLAGNAMHCRAVAAALLAAALLATRSGSRMRSRRAW